MKIETNRFGNTTMSIAKILELLEDKTIVPYEQNRGGMKGNASTPIRKMKNDFDRDSLGQLTVSENGDGKYTMADFHHRASALQELNRDHRLTKSDLEHEIAVKVVPAKKHIGVYGKKNETIKHSTANDLATTDYAMGAMLAELEQEAGFRKVTPKMRISEAYLLIALSKVTTKKYALSDLNFALIRQQDRKELTEIQKIEVGKLKLPIKSRLRKQLLAGMKYWKDVMDRTLVLKRERYHSADLARLISNSSIYTLALLDYMTGQEFTSRHSGWMANTLASKHSRILPCTRAMTSGSLQDAMSASAQVTKLLKA